MSLTSCKTVEVRTEIVAITPPDEFLKECVADQVTYTNNESLLLQNKNLERALELCNKDKLLLRQWKSNATKSP